MGPALEAPGVLEKAMRAGANAFRINFSHGDNQQHGRYLAMIRAASEKLDRPCAVLADLMGPKVRVDAREYLLPEGGEVFLVPKPGRPDHGEVGISFPALAELVSKGQKILLDDGKLEIRVLSVSGKRVRCAVVRGGELKPNKSLNVPGVDLGLPVMSVKDKEDLRFICKSGFDWVAASFVRNGEDVKSIKRFMAKLGYNLPLVAKVESAQAVTNLRDIITSAEGVMVARGDLGVELELEQIPTVQRNVIHLARELGKVTIVATQMLESMLTSPRPTRAEVTDVSTAALARVDALMLSGETATGKFPIEAIQMMDKTIRMTERNLEDEIVGITHPESLANICEAGLYLSIISGAAVVAAISIHGTTPRILSTYRGNLPVAVGCTLPAIANRSTLYYSVQPLLIKPVPSAETIFKQVADHLKTMELAVKGDVVIFVFGHPIHVPNGTNSIRRWEVD